MAKRESRRPGDRPNIRVDAGGDVSLSADEVGRDKIINRPDGEVTGKAVEERGRKSLRGTVLSWIGTIPALVRLAEFLGLSMK